MIIHDLEQGTEEWRTLRAGMPTSSNFSSLVTSTGKLSKSIEAYAMTLAADKFAGKDLRVFTGTTYTERGNELEAEARMFYSLQRDVDVEEVGFVTDDAASWGSSPDGLICDDLGMLEIKAQAPKGFVETLLKYHKTKKVPSQYIVQLNGQMLICKRKYVDLLLYHPDLKSLIIRVEPDEAIVAGLLEAKELVLSRRDEIIKIMEEL